MHFWHKSYRSDVPLLCVTAEVTNVTPPVVAAAKFGHWLRWHRPNFSIVKVPVSPSYLINQL